jgi:glucosyl-dolichyl phosphate glucuronosyltransferase
MISIVICTFNRASLLHKMLESFFRQKQIDEIPYELLIVDNNSRDETAVVARKFLKNGNVSYLREANQGLSFARNRGIAEAKGEIISFLDDDVLVHERWLSSLKACFDETDTDVVGGRVSLKFEVPPEKWVGYLFRKCLSEVDLGASRRVLSDGDGLYGANLSFRKKVFESVGIFDISAGRSGQELLSGEETQLVRKILKKGGKVVYDPDVYVEHLIGPERLQWQYFVKRAKGDGLTLEFLEPKASKSFQILRVCKALVECLKAAYSRYSMIWRTKDSYEYKVADFMFRRQRSYLNARFARLIKQ